MHRQGFYLSGRTGIMLAVVLLTVLCLSLGTVLTSNHTACAADQKTPAQTVNAGSMSALRGLQDALTSVTDQVLPSVVSIVSKRTVEVNERQVPDGFFFPFGDPNPGTPQKRQAVGYGSGVIVHSNGYILTNDHVVGGADKVTVKLKDGREFEGKVSRDQRSDLAVIKIEANNLPAVKLGDSARVKPGQIAIAMGSPFELDQTVTMGIISAIKRQEVASDGEDARFYPNLIQTDASINPGNSGGPLVNIDGEVIGINTLIRAGGSPMSGGGNIGIGFAIPVNTAKFVLDQLIAHGKVTRGYLGLTPTDLTPKMQQQYGVKEGAFVRTVEVGSPADEAKIQIEDVVTEFDGRKIKGELDLRDTIAATEPGKKVKMVVIRDKKEQTLTATVGEAPVATASTGDREAPADQKLGFSVTNVTPELADKYKLGKNMKGVVVTKVSPMSAAAEAGLAPGLVITGLNGAPVRNTTDFNAATKGLKEGDSVRLVVQTAERRGLIEFTLE